MPKLMLVCFAVLLVALAGCAGETKTPVYNNQDFGFSLAYSDGYQAEPIKWVNEETGVELKKNGKVITIQALPTGTDYAALPFDQYVKIAASVEIQNFTRLTAIEPFTSVYNIKGYKTYWEVIQHEDSDSGERDTTSIAGPIYYFPPGRAQKLGGQPVKAVMIYPDAALSVEAEEVAGSFRYLNSFVTLFRQGQRGRFSLVKKGKPFRIELPANPTTGFNWYITEMDERRFKVNRSGYDPFPTGRVGSGGISFWEIIPLTEGLSVIRLQYYRAWEGKGKAVDDYQVRILTAD